MHRQNCCTVVFAVAIESHDRRSGGACGCRIFDFDRFDEDVLANASLSVVWKGACQRMGACGEEEGRTFTSFVLR